MRWPSMRPSVRKCPRKSRPILTLRDPPCPTVSAAPFRTLEWASAGVVAVILSAICAMIVPRPTMTAAKIVRLRIYEILDGAADITMSAVKPRLHAGGEGGHFDEKDERSLNGSPLVPRTSTPIHHSSCPGEATKLCFAPMSRDSRALSVADCKSGLERTSDILMQQERGWPGH